MTSAKAMTTIAFMPRARSTRFQRSEAHNEAAVLHTFCCRVEAVASAMQRAK